MGESKKRIAAYEINYTCDTCHKGYMLTSILSMRHLMRNYETNAISTLHKCNKCGTEKFLEKEYPYLRYIKNNKENYI
jgi:hypothetical protein